MKLRASIALSVVSLLTGIARAEDDVPVLRLNSAEPRRFTSSLGFGPGGERLYAGGWDKVAFVWTRDGDRFRPDAERIFRQPIGPGGFGHVNAVAVSPDGRWLAMAGRGSSRAITRFDQVGFEWPDVGADDALLGDRGQIYVHDTRTRAVHTLRGHRGAVLDLAFAPAPAAGGEPLLVSAAEERREGLLVRRFVAWDVERLAVVAELDDQPFHPDFPFWHGMAVWSTGPGRNEIGVGFGAIDQRAGVPEVQLRVWRPAAEAAGRLAIESTGADAIWRIATNGDRSAGVQLVVGSGVWSTNGPRPQRTRNLPWAGEPVWVHGGAPLASVPGRLDRIACVLVVNVDAVRRGLPPRYEVALVDSTNWTELPGRVRLGEGPQDVPPIAAAADGRTLALSYDNIVRVYDVAALLANRAVEPQRLGGIPVDPQSVQFVRNGDATGLRIEVRAEGRDETLLFDLANSRIVPAEGWVATSRDAAGWSVTHTEDPQSRADTIVVSSGGRETCRIALEEVAQADARAVAFSAAAVSPPNAVPGLPPLLVVATTVRGEPFLHVYDARDGRRLRTFSGHVEAIRSTAFAPDGQLLATASADGTVGLWWLPDLLETLGERGMIRGLGVVDSQRGLGVESSDNAALGKGDVIDGIVRDGKLTTFESALDLYFALSLTKPGETIVIRRQRGDRRDDVPLPIDQAIDDRKPLATISFDRDEAGWRWLAWSPQGVFDASDREIERSLGWHFNRWEPERPVEFSTAAEFRDRDRRPGLLGRLVETGRVARVEPRIPEVAARLAWSGGQPELRLEFDGRSDLAPRQGVLTFKGGREIPFGREGQPAIDLAMPDLARIPLPPDAAGLVPDRIAFDLAPNGPRPRRTAVDLPVAYAPIDVRIQEPLAAVVTVNDPRFTFEYEVSTSRRVEVSVVRREGEATEPIGKPRAIEKDETLRTEVELKVGRNDFEVRLAPLDGGPGTAGVLRTVTYERTAPPPRITIASIETIDGDGRRIDAGTSERPAVVHGRQIRIRGRIDAEGLLASAEVRSPSRVEGGARSLSGFEPNRARSFEFEEVVTFPQPGEHVVRISAKAGPDERELPLHFKYVPLPPQLVRIGKSDEEQPIPLVVGEDGTAKVVVAARVLPHESGAAWAKLATKAGMLDTTVIVGDERFPDAKVPVNATVLELATLLQADEKRLVDVHELQFWTTNEFGTEWTSTPMSFVVHHPPRLELAEARIDEESGRAVVPGTITSPENRPPTALALTLDGETIEAVTKFLKQREGRWSFELPVGLGERARHLEVAAVNVDGRSRPVALDLEARARPAPEPAVVNFLAPIGPAAGTAEELLEVRVVAVSSTEVTEATLIVRAAGQEDRLLELVDEDPNDGVWTARVAVRLAEGTNELVASVVNAGGAASRRVDVRYTPPPFALRVTAIDDGGMQRVPRHTVSGIVFDPLEQGDVEIRGDVVRREGFGDSTVGPLHVWVNGFMTPVQWSLTNDPTRAEFRARVLLNRTENFVKLTLPDLAESQGSVSHGGRFELDCRRPAENQHIHLIVVGVELDEVDRNRADGGELEAQIRVALLAAQGNKAFAKWHTAHLPATHGESTRPADADNFRRLLRDADLAVRSRLRNERVSDVVVVYYRGRELHVKDRGAVLQDERYRTNARYQQHVSFAELDDRLSSMAGAHLLLLDLDAADDANPAERWGPNLGVLRVSRRPAGELLVDILAREIPMRVRSGDVLLETLEQVVPGEEGVDGSFPNELRKLLLAR